MKIGMSNKLEIDIETGMRLLIDNRMEIELRIEMGI